MKRKYIALRNLATLALLVCAFIACDKDFTDIDSDIINPNNATHFGVIARDFDVIAYTRALEPVQTNNLPVNLLGYYDDPMYGGTSASIVSQLSSSDLDPDFGANAALDSVILTIPYFSTPVNVTEDGETQYVLDSIFGNAATKLSLFESNYFLRNINPETEGDINAAQLYYSNMSTGIDNIDPSLLEGQEIPIIEVANDYIELDNFIPSNRQIILTNTAGELIGRQAPAFRLKLETGYWTNKILNMAGTPELSNLNNFRNYFRGLYMKSEPKGAWPAGNMMLLNLASENSNITLYYSSDDPENSEERIQSTYVLEFNGNRINFLSNSFTIPNGNENTGDTNLFIKGGQGSIAEIKLFNGDDLDEDPTENAFEAFKNEFVETDENGKFVRSKKLVNEANLVVYVNQDLVNGEEPERLFLFDMENNVPLTDYFLDAANTTLPEFSRINHLGRLQRQGSSSNGSGVKYKIRITEHINNLLIRDSTNIKLGLAVSGNVNLENNSPQYDVLTLDETDESIPVSSIVTPRGTILYGNMVGDEEKKLYLEIIFTEPNN